MNTTREMKTLTTSAEIKAIHATLNTTGKKAWDCDCAHCKPTPYEESYWVNKVAK